MDTLVRRDLLDRLRDHEDSFVERKLEGADLKRTIVAFANSLPTGREAVIYVGVGDDGQIRGVSNPDSLQKKLRRICVEECYPSVQFTTEILRVENTAILAVVIPPSSDKPHFAGPAYIRRGSESISASRELFQDLITSRISKAAELLRYVNQAVTVFTQKQQLGRPEFAEMVAGTSLRAGGRSYDCIVQRVNPFFVTLFEPGSGTHFSEPLANVEISYDDAKHRPLLIVKLDGA